ncbi:tetratricopeptide repeat protein [Pendulispora brunnea]|uniref:Tetratricopeptide repeat protein n=1 Tax=Pendulispora brunnea TaxID=2905690 RepID=A0ABZ2KNA1_9BACT
MNEQAKLSLERARTAAGAGAVDEARAAYANAAVVDPEDPSLWSEQGIFLLDVARDPEAAIVAFRQSLAIRRTYADHYNLGNALLAVGRMEAALEEYDASIECKQDYAEAWTNRGIVLFNLTRHEQSRDSFERALEVNPRLANAWRCLRILLEELDENEAAVEASRHFAEIVENDGEAWLKYAAGAGKLLDEQVVRHEVEGPEERILAAVERALDLPLAPESRRWALVERIRRLQRLAHGRQSMARALNVPGLEVLRTVQRYREAAEQAAREVPDDPWLAEQLEDARELAGVRSE